MRSTSRPSGRSMPTRISPCSAHLARCLASSSNPSHEWVTAARPRILPAGSTTQTSWDSLAQSMPTNITPPSDRGACPVTEARRGSLLTGARGASSHGRSALPGAGGGGGITLALEGRWTPALPPPVTEMLGASTPGEAVPWNPTQEGWTSNGRHRRRPKVPYIPAPGGLPRPGCPGSSVRIGTSSPRTNLQAGFGGGQTPAGGGGVGGHADPWAAPGVRRAGARAARRQHRHGGRGPKAGRAVLASAHPGGGLRLRPALPAPGEDPTPRAGRRRPEPQRLPQPGPVFATPAQRRLEREVGAQAEKAYRRFVKDFRSSGKKGAGATTGARISAARKGQAARQGQAPDPAL